MPALIPFNQIQGPIGAFGFATVDITRHGRLKHKFKQIGQRGQRQSVQAHTFHQDRTEAVGFVASLQSHVGTEIVAFDSLENLRYPVMLHSFSYFPPKKIVSTAGHSFMVRYTLDITRTSAVP